MRSIQASGCYHPGVCTQY